MEQTLLAKKYKIDDAIKQKTDSGKKSRIIQERFVK